MSWKAENPRHPASTSPQGIYRDRILPARGREIDLGWRSNLVADRCHVLLAAFMRGPGAVGIRFLLVGRGRESWDLSPEPPRRSIRALTDPEPLRIPLEGSQIDYLDAVGGVAAEPSPHLRVTVTLGPGVPPLAGGDESYPLREFGLFGRLAGEDTMIDYVRHPVIHKRADDTLVRTIRLVF